MFALSQRRRDLSTLFLISFFLSGSVFADSRPIFPNTDAIEFWLFNSELNNRLEMRERDRLHALAEIKKQRALHEQHIGLREKNAISPEEFEQSLLDYDMAKIEAESLAIQVEEIGWDKKIVTLRYEGSIGKPVKISDLMRLHVERWKTRIASAKLEVRRAEREGTFRKFIYKLSHNLYLRKHLTDSELVIERSRLEKTLANITLQKRRVEIAEKALKEAIDGVADAG